MPETIKTPEALAIEVTSLLGRVAQQITPHGSEKYDAMGTIVVPLHINSKEARMLASLLGAATVSADDVEHELSLADQVKEEGANDYVERLRDLIAIEHLKLCADKLMKACHEAGHPPETGIKVTALHCYSMANAMIAAREVKAHG